MCIRGDDTSGILTWKIMTMIKYDDDDDEGGDVNDVFEMVLVLTSL